MKNILTRLNTIHKKFSYNKNNVNLVFDLRIDVKEELKDFLELLENAIEEVKEDLSRL